MAVIGLNPGNAGGKEKLLYKILAERNPDISAQARGVATYSDCLMVWHTIYKEAPYYRRTMHLLRQLPGLNLSGINGVLWAEVAFCEKDKGKAGSVSSRMVKRCSREFLEPEIAGLLSEQTYVLCLGKIAYKHVKDLAGSDHWKIVGIYHPTGSRGKSSFSSYFKNDKAKQLGSRKLDTRILRNFRDAKCGRPIFLQQAF